MPFVKEWARADTFRVLREHCRRNSLDWKAFADKLDLDDGVVDDPKGIVPISTWFAMFEEVAEALDDDAVLYDVYNSLETGVFSSFDYMFVYAPTLRDACLAWQRFMPTRTNAYPLKFIEGPIRTAIEWPILEGRGPWRQNMQSRFGWAARQFELALENDTPPLAFEIAADAPLKMSNFQRKYGCSIAFNSLHNRISFPSAILDEPLGKHQANLYEIIEKVAINELVEFQALDSPVSRIASEISNTLITGSCNLRQVATNIGMSPRAMQRILEQDGTSFRKLTEDIRRSTAARYLKTTDLPLKEISFLLGFSDLSTFSRAVKTWFGQSPRKVRGSETNLVARS